MWNSPRQNTIGGKRYTHSEIAALLEPLELMLDALRMSPPSEVVTAPILQRMGKGELIFATHELFDALMGESVHPPGGHPGYLEALIAELLDQCCGLVELELADDYGRTGAPARRAAWSSFAALCGERGQNGQTRYPLIESLELLYDDPEVHRCPLLTAEMWQEILLGEAGSVAGEFLWDYDWRTDSFGECEVGQGGGWAAESERLNHEWVSVSPPTPSARQLAVARARLRRLAETHARNG